jgi:hypothetical protein
LILYNEKRESTFWVVCPYIHPAFSFTRETCTEKQLAMETKKIYTKLEYWNTGQIFGYIDWNVDWEENLRDWNTGILEIGQIDTSM